MRIVSANITGSLILNGVDVTDSLVSSSINSGSVSSKLDSLQSSTSSLNSFTSSYSTGSFTGSFKGDGTNLYNIPATGVTGLQLDKIASGAVTASVSANGFNVNSNVSITGSIVASGTSLVSGSSQINITGTTEYSTFSSSVSTSIGSLSSSVASTTNTLSSSVSSSIGSLSSSVATTTSGLSSSLSSSIGSLSSSVATTTLGTKNRVDSIEVKTGSFATTGSNTFIGTENITGNLTVTGSVIISSGSAVYNSSLNLTDTSSLTLNSGSNLYVYDTGIISGTFKGSVTGSLGINGNVSITGSIVASGTSLVSGSSQIDITSTTNYTTFSSSVSSSIGNLSSSVATNTSGLAGRITIIEGRGATTGSNTFIGTQTITGSLYISSNLIVQGSSSLQDITASMVNIGANIINLNTANPAIRFAGLNIFDSGSIGGSGSFLYDAVQDEFIFVHRGDNTNITSSVVMMGPQTYNNIGNETYPTTNYILKGTGNEHVGDSCIIDNGTTVCVNATLKSSGQVCGVVGTFSCVGIGTNIPSSGRLEIQETTCKPGLWVQTGGTTISYCVASFRTGTNLAALEIYGNGTSVFGNNICVNANSNTFGTAATSGRAIVVQAGSTNQAIQFKNCWGGDGTLYACGNATAFHYGFNTYSCSDVLFIANGGNIGIGTSNPQAKLHISINERSTPRGSGFTKLFLTSCDADTNYYEFQTPSTAASDFLFSSLNTGDYGVIGYSMCTHSFRVYTKSAPRFGINCDGIATFCCQVCSAGTFFSNVGASTSTYGFTHCGASRWGRFGMPNSSYMYLETNADLGFYIDGQTRVGGYFCASGNIQGAHLKMYSSICANGVRLGGGSFNTGYTSDGIYGATATPSYIVGSGYNSGFYLGYVDNGSGLYGAAYAFNVKCSHGGGGSGTAEYDAIRMRNDESGVVPFRLTNWGNLYATSKNFRINHPLPSMNNTHHLIHTAIEGPQADLIYRGKVELVNGKAEVNIDESSRMTIGTFELLCQNVQSYTTNESGWVLIKSYVIGNILHIEAQDETSDDIISWLVIGERKDDGMKNSNITDNDCHLVVETLIPELELES